MRTRVIQIRVLHTHTTPLHLTAYSRSDTPVSFTLFGEKTASRGISIFILRYSPVRQTPNTVFENSTKIHVPNARLNFANFRGCANFQDGVFCHYLQQISFKKQKMAMDMLCEIKIQLTFQRF